jgi:hypothetical protein
MSWVDHIEGTLPADDLRRAFVMGAAWWEMQITGSTLFSSERHLAENKAEEMFPGGKPPRSSSSPPKPAPRVYKIG